MIINTGNALIYNRSLTNAHTRRTRTASIHHSAAHIHVLLGLYSSLRTVTITPFLAGPSRASPPPEGQIINAHMSFTSFCLNNV